MAQDELMFASLSIFEHGWTGIAFFRIWMCSACQCEAHSEAGTAEPGLPIELRHQ